MQSPTRTAPRRRTRTVALAIALVAGAGLLSACTSPQQGQQAANSARFMVGQPYIYGGSTPSGFDCSGLTSWAWAQAGVFIPRTATDQYWATNRVNRFELQPGDLGFYGSSIYDIQHVLIYMGGGLAVSASNPGTGVQIVNIDQWWTDGLVGFGRV